MVPPLAKAARARRAARAAPQEALTSRAAPAAWVGRPLQQLAPATLRPSLAAQRVDRLAQAPPQVPLRLLPVAPLPRVGRPPRSPLPLPVRPRPRLFPRREAQAQQARPLRALQAISSRLHCISSWSGSPADATLFWVVAGLSGVCGFGNGDAATFPLRRRGAGGDGLAMPINAVVQNGAYSSGEFCPAWSHITPVSHVA